MISLSFPLSFTGDTFGTAFYPFRKGKIAIYLADHSYVCNGDIRKIIKELNITILEEMTHILYGKRHGKNHDNWGKCLKKIIV